MFTSKEETLEFTATFETSISGLREDTDLYENVDSNNEVSFTAANHTTGGSKVYRMNQSNPSGPGIMLRVYPGDTVEPSVYAYHENSSGYGTSSTSLAAMITAIAGAFGGVNGSGGESQAIYDTFNDALGVLGLGGNRGDDTPAAYLNYIFFDETEGYSETTQGDDSGWIPVPSGAYYDTALVKFGSPIIIEKPGYIYIYLSYENESNNYVYFDDLKVTYTKSQVVQSNNYYAFGLQTKDSWTRMDTKPNQYLYNAGSELNTLTSNYEMLFRSYDPTIGRMSGVDPMVDKYASMTPYNYSMNDPIYYNDPTGAEYEWASMGGCGCWKDKGAQDGGGQSNGMYGSNWNAATYGTGFAKYGPGDGGALDNLGDAAAARLKLKQWINDGLIASYGGGLPGLTSAMFALNAVGYDRYGAGTFSYSIGNSKYGGTYHTTGGVVTSAAVSQVMSSFSGNGGLVAVGGLEIFEFGVVQYNGSGSSGISNSSNLFYGAFSGVASVAGFGVEIAKSEIKSGAVYATQAGAKGVKLLGRGVTGLSLAASTAQLIFNDNRKPSDYARFTGSVLITGSAAIPYAGPYISFGLGTADAAGAFEDFYKSWDIPGMPIVYLNMAMRYLPR